MSSVCFYMVVLKHSNLIMIFSVSFQSPPKGATIPYRPKPQVNGPVILANGQAYTIQGNFALPTQEVCRRVLIVRVTKPHVVPFLLLRIILDM